MNQVTSEQASTTAPTGSLPEASAGGGSHRRAVRAFVLVVAAVLIIDAAPTSWTWLTKPKQVVSAVTNRMGLWQGQWSMFAPDPVLSNGWFTAELQHTDGSQSQWNSPYWNQATSSDKFFQFRYMNYFNRLPNLSYDAARDDLADHLARRSTLPVESVKLYHTRMQLVMPEDGSLPKRDEATWMLSSQLAAKRTYTAPSVLPQSHSQKSSSLKNSSQRNSSENGSVAAPFQQLDSQH